MNHAEMVYRTTARFPRDEAYGLTSQLRLPTASLKPEPPNGCQH
jgi:hypothetical protein